MRNATTIRGGPRWFRFIDKVLDYTSTLFQSLAELMLAIMLVINILNITLRNTGQPSLLWVSPWTGVMMVWCVFFAFYVMYRRHLDIVLVIVVSRMGRLGLKLSRILTALTGLVVVSVLLVEAPQIFTRQRGTMELIGLTRYWLSVPLIASSFMLFLHFVIDLVAIFGGWADPEPAGDEEAAQW